VRASRTAVPAKAAATAVQVAAPAAVNSGASEPAPSPVLAVDAGSGDSTALAGQVDTTDANTQIGAASVAGGSAPVTVANSHSSTIADGSAASSGSGVSVALAPTPGAGATQTGVTTAQSGSASALGASIANDVANQSQAAVLVQGANYAPVNVGSNAALSIQDTGAAGTTSGAAWAVAAGAAGAPSGVATPVTAGAAATSAALSATGIQAQNALSNSTSAVVNVAGANAAPINITPAEVVSMNTGGYATTTSGAACAGVGCASPASTTAGGATQATSGASQAQGLVAQNNVKTNANVAVNIAGQNFAPITIIINSITTIFNWGAGSATSGDAVANGSSTGSSGSSGGASGVASGSAQATGAEVSNSVDLRSSAAVHVAGDNYNPINILLNLGADLVNWGVATATSGDAQSSGSGGGTVTSGSASATGLRAVNLVSLWADASVDIDGNNYAPIFIKIQFNTNVANVGYAGSSSGNVAVGQPASSSSSSNNSAQPGTGSSGSTGGATSRAQSGSAVAISNSANVGVASNQIASANGGDPINTTVVTSMLRNLPTGTWNPFVQQSLPDTAAPAVIAGMSSSSGNSTAVGLQSNIGATNGQIAACSDPSANCTATNSSSMSISISDLPYNPATKPDGSARGSGNNGHPNEPGFGPGDTSAQSGFTGVNATPTPAATASSNSGTNNSAFDDGSDDSGSGGSGVRRKFFAANAVADGFVVDGHYVLVDLFDNWPGRRLPPMPNPLKTGVASSTVGVSLSGFPGVDELPLPMPGGSDVSGSAPTAGGAAGTTLRQPVGTASHDQAASDGDDVYPLLALVDVDPWGWPAAESLPMPVQVMAAPSPSTAAQSVAVPVPESTAPLGPDNGAMPMQFDLAAWLSVLALTLQVGARHGRVLLAVVGSWFDQRRRAQILLRLASGMLRLW
jgi:hypothetical protein